MAASLRGVCALDLPDRHVAAPHCQGGERERRRLRGRRSRFSDVRFRQPRRGAFRECGSVRSDARYREVDRLRRRAAFLRRRRRLARHDRLRGAAVRVRAAEGACARCRRAGADRRLGLPRAVQSAGAVGCVVREPPRHHFVVLVRSDPSTRMRLAWLSILFALTVAAGAAPVRSVAPDDINSAEFKGGKNSEPVNIRSQVLLDRARFSPGVIDGRHGENFSNALRAYQDQKGLKPSGELDTPTWEQLTQDDQPAAIEYTITDEDVKGPFTDDIPKKMEKQADLKRLDYTSPAEMLAERFHMDEDLLKRLNRGKKLDEAGATITVANV